MQEVVTGLSGKPDKLYAEGLHIAGERYVLTKAEDRSLYARKVRLLRSQGGLETFIQMARALKFFKKKTDREHRAEKVSSSSKPHKLSSSPITQTE